MNVAFAAAKRYDLALSLEDIGSLRLKMGHIRVATGKVVRFDEFRGYGFVAPDTGGEDVFIHVNDLDFDKHLIGPGALVEFDVDDGDRGPKASRVRILSRPTSQSTAPKIANTLSRRATDDSLCDLLTAKEFRDEVTETLLNASPTVTADQILRIREGLVRIADSHGWIET
jgi:CspA family cold shock protein